MNADLADQRGGSYFVGGVSDPDAGSQAVDHSKWNAKSASETPPTSLLCYFAMLYRRASLR